jgi:membrane protein DedA with SNARE-associated domain
LPAIIGLESMGIPSPGETALVLAAVLASQGKLDIRLVIGIGVISAIAGDNAGYWLGRRFGRRVLERRGPFLRHRLELVALGDRYFARHGGKTVFIGRWLALIRFATAWLAGINGMRWLTFLLWNAFGGVTWGAAYGLAGYYGGKGATGVLGKVGIAGAAILVATLVGGLVLLRRRERRELHTMRAGEDPQASEERSGERACPG